MGFRYRIKGLPALERGLQRISQAKFEAVTNKNMMEIFNYAGTPPGTPRDTGELIRGRRIELSRPGDSKWKARFGYVKDYAPHLEYGHRVRGGGYVSGRRYLEKNVKRQKETYRADILKEIRNSAK